jgi:hypothetical protein
MTTPATVTAKPPIWAWCNGSRVDDLSFDLFGAFEDLWRGQDAHPAQLCVKPDQCGNVCFIVLERVDIAFRSLLDEFLVEVLSAHDVAREPLRARLRPLGQPGREDGCEAAYGGSH